MDVGLCDGFWGGFGFDLDICGVAILIVVLCFVLVGCLVVGVCFAVSSRVWWF